MSVPNFSSLAGVEVARLISLVDKEGWLRLMRFALIGYLNQVWVSVVLSVPNFSSQAGLCKQKSQQGCGRWAPYRHLTPLCSDLACGILRIGWVIKKKLTGRDGKRYRGGRKHAMSFSPLDWDILISSFKNIKFSFCNYPCLQALEVNKYEYIENAIKIKD